MENVKTWLNWSNSVPPTRLFHNGRMVSSPAGCAGTMNSFFLGKVAGLRENIPQATDPLSKLRESMSKVLKIIKSLKNSKSTGTDNVDTYVIKLVAQDILAPLTHINNLSISKSHFPQSGSMLRLCLC